MPSLLKLRGVPNDPAENGAGRNQDAKLSGHFCLVAVAELEPKIPDDRERNELIGKTSTVEERVARCKPEGHPTIVNFVRSSMQQNHLNHSRL